MTLLREQKGKPKIGIHIHNSLVSKIYKEFLKVKSQLKMGKRFVQTLYQNRMANKHVK